MAGRGRCGGTRRQNRTASSSTPDTPSGGFAPNPRTYFLYSVASGHKFQHGALSLTPLSVQALLFCLPPCRCLRRQLRRARAAREWGDPKLIAAPDLRRQPASERVCGGPRQSGSRRHIHGLESRHCVVYMHCAAATDEDKNCRGGAHERFY